MSLRSKLGLSLASLALGTSLACGPKPTINEFCPVSDRAELQYEGPTSLGPVRFYAIRHIYEQDKIALYQACLDTSLNGSFYEFTDKNLSGILGDDENDYVLEFKKINGEFTTFAEYDVNGTVRYHPFARFRKGQGPLADKAIEQSRRRVTGEFNEMYKTIFEEIADKVGPRSQK